MNPAFLDTFDREFAPKLAKRANTFRAVFAALPNNATIVETGTLYMPGFWDGHGNSTVLFDRYVQMCGGHLYTVDIEPRADTVRPLVSKHTTLICANSVDYLKTDNQLRIDLLYLDSMDGQLEGAAAHQLQEFQAARRLLKRGAIVFIDDIDTKGTLLIPYLDYNVCAKRLTSGDIQLAWRMPS